MSKYSREVGLLVVVCALDTILTVLFVQLGVATEANPIMRFFLDRGYAAFVIAKMLPVLCAAFVCEAYRQHNPQFVKRVVQMALVAYVGLYSCLLPIINLT